jgi:hypothetical protein
MINQKPQRAFFSRWGLAYLEPFHLDSTFAASESHPFIRNSRRNGRDDGYRYDVFQVTLRHLNYVYVYEFNSDLSLIPDSDSPWALYRNAKRDFLLKRCR